MTITTVLKGFRKKFQNNGSFTLSRGESIGAAVRKHHVPNEFGVYVISIEGKPTQFIYVGKAGTVTTDGQWKKQGLRQRLTKKRGAKAASRSFETSSRKTIFRVCASSGS